MTSPDLHMFTALAADLSKREARARAALPASETVLGLGRFVVELGEYVGAFARGTNDRSSGAPNGLVVSFINRDPTTGRTNTIGKTTYRPRDGLVTVTDPSENMFSVGGLILALNGVLIRRRLPEAPGKLFRVAEDELDYLADFVYGDPDHPTAMHAYHRVGQPGHADEDMAVSQVDGV